MPVIHWKTVRPLFSFSTLNTITNLSSLNVGNASFVDNFFLTYVTVFFLIA